MLALYAARPKAAVITTSRTPTTSECSIRAPR